MKAIQFPEFVYVPTYGLTGVAYGAGVPPNWSWHERDFGPNSAVFDSDAVHSLERLVSGPVAQWSVLEIAELAIRAIVLHERLYWLLPAVLCIGPESTVKNGGPPVVQDGGHVIYPRYPDLPSILPVLRDAGASSYSVYSTWVYVKDGTPTDGDPFWMKNYRRLRSPDNDVVREVFTESLAYKYFRDSYIASPKAIGAGAYFGNPEDRTYEQALMRDHATKLPEKALKRIDSDWDVDVGGGAIGLNIRLGPFLAMVLERAETRSRIPVAISELRKEFGSGRAEFWDLFQSPLREKRLGVAIKDLRKLEGALASVIPASFSRKESPLRFIWNTAHVIADVAANGGALSVVRLLGDFFLGKDYHWAQVSNVDLTKMLATKLRALDNSLVTQLKRHLTDPELQSLGVL